MGKVRPKRPRGRPATGKGVPVQVRLQPDLLSRIDLYRRVAPIRSRAEIIRMMVSEWAEGSDLVEPDETGASRPILVPLAPDVLADLLDICELRYGYRMDRGMALREMLEEFLTLHKAGVIPHRSADDDG